MTDKKLPDYQQVQEKLETVRDFIRLGASLFEQHQLYFGHGTDNAIDEAAYLVSRALHLPHPLHSDYLGAVLLEEEKQKIWRYFEQRLCQQLPAAYITHHARFCNLDFYVDERVLIPRSPIAEMIMARFYPWVAEEQVAHILDVCTGSGCIAIACAYAFMDAEVDAIDISKKALAVAEINRRKHHLQEQLQLIHSDLFTALQGKSAYQHKYDIIVSNPPYVDAQDMSDLPPEYRAEPELGLKADADGLKLVVPILHEAAQYLNEQGILVVEVGNSAAALELKYPHVPFYWVELKHGGQGVFVFTRAQLLEYFH